MQNNKINLLIEVANYYSEKLNQFGVTPQGVDWNGEESQMLRFEQLSKVIGVSTSFSINDLGCGYGAFYDFLTGRYNAFDYLGIDISESMIQAAEHRYQDIISSAKFILSEKPNRVADYGIASGIFNVRLNQSNQEWRSYFEDALDALSDSSRLGFAFNCLTSYSNSGRMRDDLYYADPCVVFDFCKCRYSPNVALLHDYGLYEFTILVRKEL